MDERRGFILKLANRRTGHASYGCADPNPWIVGKESNQIREVDTHEEATKHPLFNEGYARGWAEILMQANPARYYLVLYLPLDTEE